ncbi:hypothetical protein MMC07_007245 [Pseudocyphellaria aurata]|nr:hypothetical protein [Pseudocyphellaria aurata]
MSSGENNCGQGRHNNPPNENDAHASQGHQGRPRRPSMAIEDMLNPVIGEQGSDGGSQPNHGPRTLESAQQADRPTSSSSVNGRPRTSSSASSSPGTKERRPFRPAYSDEEAHFIWYCRIDLGYNWWYLTNAYNARFPDRPRASIGGIQCKYYRHCEATGIPKVRDRGRGARQVLKYGMRSRTGLTYPWMRDC